MTTSHLRGTPFALALVLASAAWSDAALVSVSGAVEIGRGTPLVWRAAHAGDAVAAGEAVRTGAASRAELRLGDQRVARLYERSLLRVGADATASGSVRSVDLDEGASLFDLVRRAVADEFDVHTPEIIVSVKGTRFLVSAGEGPDHASVFRGEVSLAEAGFDTLSLLPGFTGALGEIQPTPFADPWDSWVSDAHAPAIAIEGAVDDEIRAAVEAARDAELEPPASLDMDGPGKPKGDDGLELPGVDVERSESSLELPSLDVELPERGIELDPVLDIVLDDDDDD